MRSWDCVDILFDAASFPLGKLESFSVYRVSLLNGGFRLLLIVIGSSLVVKGDLEQSRSIETDVDETLKMEKPLSVPHGSGTRAGLFRTPISGGVQSATSAHGLPRPALAVRNLMEQVKARCLSSPDNFKTLLASFNKHAYLMSDRSLYKFRCN